MRRTLEVVSIYCVRIQNLYKQDIQEVLTGYQAIIMPAELIYTDLPNH